MNKTLEPLEVRVQRSLQGIGFTGIKALHSGGGSITLQGVVASSTERSIVYSATKTVVGVREILNELTLNDRDV